MKIYDRRVISLFLAIIMSTLLIIGCSEPTDKISDTTTSDAVSTDTVAIDSDEAPDFRKIVPITDFNGWQYCMLSIQNSAMSAFFDYELTTEELTGEVVNDAVYTRNMTIEEAFNITLTENRVPDFLNVVQKCVQSGDNAYQLVIGGWGDMATLSTTGALLDWNSDKNGDSKYDENDFYGLLTSHGGTLVFTYAFDNKTTPPAIDYKGAPHKY